MENTLAVLVLWFSLEYVMINHFYLMDGFLFHYDKN